MGKRKRRHRSSDEEERDRLKNRVKWLEEQVRKYGKKKCDNKRSNRRESSTRSRSRSGSHRRDPADYYHGDYHSDDGSHAYYSDFQNENRRSRRSHSRRHERDSSHTDHACRRDRALSADYARNSRSESPKENFGMQVQVHSTSPILDLPQECNISDAEANVVQAVLQTAADAPVVSTGAITAKEKATSEEVSVEAQEIELQADILEVVGECLRPERVLAPPVHSHLATLWCEVIEKGLPAEERKGFLKKVSPPENCTFVDPPKLNLEIKAALDSTIIKRDERITEKQEKVAASLSSVGKVIDLIIKSNPADMKQYLEPLNVAVKLLADLQHDETSIRKILILKNIKAPFRDTLKDLSSGDWLFGRDLSEKIKAAKVLQQSSRDLKQPVKQLFDQGKNSKNTRGPPQQNQHRLNTYSRGGGYKQSHNNYSRNNNYNRGNRPMIRGRNYQQKQEHLLPKKIN